MKKNRDFIMVLITCIILILIALCLFLIGTQKVHAAVITGERSLGGGSYWLNKYIEATGHCPYSEDIELLAEVMFHENWHTDKEHKAAYYTGAVVLNRLKHKNYPNTIKEVLYQVNPTQYSTTHKFYTVQIPKECYRMASMLLKYGAPDVPEVVIYQSQFHQGKGVWKIIEGEYFCYE